jgi:polyisoprenoid-binding protein YceI
MTAPSITDATELPAGIWMSDRVHSSIGFSIKHMLVNTFHAGFNDFSAHLAVEPDGQATLTGTVRAASIAVRDAILATHLASPDFFDAEHHPELRFESTTIRRTGELVELSGRLTIKGRTLPITAMGTVVDAHEDTHGQTRIALELETLVDRRQFGLDWNMPLPKGGFALSNEVRLQANIAFVRT